MYKIEAKVTGRISRVKEIQAYALWFIATIISMDLCVLFCVFSRCGWYIQNVDEIAEP